MSSFSHHNVALFILDLCHQIGQVSDFLLERILRCVGFRHIYYSVNVEGDLFRVCGPVFIGEAVDVFAVHLRGEGMVAVRDGAFVELVIALWVCYLSHCVLAMVLFKIDFFESRRMYPEFNVQISAASKFAVANLEGDGHLIVAV